MGLIADSHVGEFLDALPAGVMDALDGCDLLLHAGDLSVPSVLDDLGALAPTFAVRGDHDRLDDLALPETLVATVAGRRIGLVHGTLGPITDAAVVSAHVVAGRRLAYDGDLHARLLRRVGPVDCLVYGHWHEPRSAMVDATLCVSPGAVCPRGTLAGAGHRGRALRGCPTAVFGASGASLGPSRCSRPSPSWRWGPRASGRDGSRSQTPPTTARSGGLIECRADELRTRLNARTRR